MKKTEHNRHKRCAEKLSSRARQSGEALRAVALPESMARACPCVNIMSDAHIEVENHMGVLEFSDKRVRVHTALGIMCVEGSALEIRNADSQSLLIDGRIRSVCYENAD